MEGHLGEINVNQVLLYLGYHGGQVPDEVEESIARCWAELKTAARPRCLWRAFELEEGCRPAGTALTLEGADIRAHLGGCSQVVLMAATLGPDVETLLMRAQITDMARAVVLDACASSAIENVCDNLEQELRADCAAQGRYLTDRYSPGYGDMPIRQQGDFCRVLDTQRRMGLTVSERDLLIPRKSVTAVLGIADTPRTRRSRGCEHCSMFRTCAYRKEGGCCGK
jgi:hypothetical protein